MELTPIGKIKQEKANPPVASGGTNSSNSYIVPPNIVKDFHSRSDVDSSLSSQHHTLGFRKNQASPGNHTHDGTSSVKIAKGASLTLTGSKGGNTALTNLINMLKPYIEFIDNTT